MGAHRNNWTCLILVCLETSLFRGILPWQQAWPGVTLEWWLLIDGNSTWHCSAPSVCFLFFMSSLLELLCARPARMVPVKFRGDLGYCFIQERQGEKARLVLTCFWRDRAKAAMVSRLNGGSCHNQSVSLSWIFSQPLTSMVGIHRSC